MRERQEHAHGDDVIYIERLWPAPWIWAVLLGVSWVWVVILAPVSITAGLVMAVILTVILSVLLVLSTPRLVVTGETLRVGRAQIERRYLGNAEFFDGAEASVQRGAQLDATAYLCIRGWICPLVRIDVVDERDPVPYWLMSTRHPKQLVATLTPGAS